MDMPTQCFIETILPEIPNPYNIKIVVHSFLDDEIYIMSIKRPDKSPPGSGFNYLADIMRKCDEYRINATLEITDHNGLDKLVQLYQELGFIADQDNQDENGIEMFRPSSDKPSQFSYRKIDSKGHKNKITIGYS